jgi:hypothetical protein
MPLAALVVAALLLVPGPGSAHGRSRFEIGILSSAPDQVSGGDALVQVRVPRGKHRRFVLLRNGRDVTDALERQPDGSWRGVIDGLRLGQNRLELRPHRRSHTLLDRLSVENHPESGPIFSGPQQQPFVCTTARVGLGQPLVDNPDGIGIRVAREDAAGNYPRDGRGYPTAEAEIVGFSKDCAARRKLEYQYRSTDGQFRPLASPGGPLPADIDTTTTLDGHTVPYIVRFERGTLNRFIYSVAMLAPTRETDPLAPDDSLWNGRLVFSLQGGVAIGHHQGTTSTSVMLLHDALRLGYAVVNSTGLRTNTHYNLQLGGETALMLKEHFVEDHGVPLYTIGVGGSGGAIQQYVYAQNHPGLLDAGVPQYSYSDMITQTIHVGDCELLEHYFEATDRANPKWKNVANRRLIEGLNVSRTPANMSASEASQWLQLYGLYDWFGFSAPARRLADSVPAITECRRAWFGLTPLALNPTFTNVADLDKLAQGAEGVQWTHTADLVNIYGSDETGFARMPWDNVGVQYGLTALTDGAITPAEFLDLNARIGSWKHPSEMVTEGFPFVGDVDLGDSASFDPWSSRNMSLSPDGGVTPAPRRSGDLRAIRAAYRSGMVFQGGAGIPIIDWRHYLEDELDMHHSHQSFATRRRIQQKRGNADNQLIWFTDARPARAFDQTPEAFAVLDEWLANLRAHPERGVAGNRPPDAVDRCFDTNGVEIARGPHVWDGILDDRPPGPCTGHFPLHRTSRIVAGGPLEGGIFKCVTEPVDDAIARGVYGAWQPTDAERARLREIFPDGVCDWSRGDAGRPGQRKRH